MSSDADIFKHPFFDEFDESVHKIRRNLILSSSVAILIVWFNLPINSKADLLIFSVQGLTQTRVYWVLFFIVLYNFLHFFVVSATFFQKWRMSVTGQKGLFFDSTNGEKQSSLYWWWSHRKDELLAIQEAKISLKDYEHVLQALKRFDEAFWRFQKWQWIRWVAIEAWFPMALGVWALVWLFSCHP